MATEIPRETIRQYVVQKLKLGFSQSLPNPVKVDTRLDYELDSFIFEVTAIVLTNEVKNEHSEIKMPENWWEHFKERFLSRWLTVKYRTVTIQTTYRACPHLKIPDDKLHVDFLIYGVSSANRE